jgi:hypothetical protein
MITTNIIQRVFYIGKDDNVGTGFTIEHRNAQFLISAFHIFDGIKDGEPFVITIYHNSVWKALELIPHIHENAEIDIVVFELPFDLSPRHPIGIGIGGLKLGQDTFFLGFPYGMFSEDKNKINNKFPFPFVKKGTCSAVNFDEIEGTLIYLDGHTNPGFSGGPMVWMDSKTNELKIGGVMRGYVVHEGKVNFEDINEDGEIEEDSFEYEENSGIIKIHSISHAIEIIENIKK